jgi:hypothetical protein
MLDAEEAIFGAETQLLGISLQATPLPTWLRLEQFLTSARRCVCVSLNGDMCPGMVRTPSPRRSQLFVRSLE